MPIRFVDKGAPSIARQVGKRFVSGPSDARRSRCGLLLSTNRIGMVDSSRIRRHQGRKLFPEQGLVLDDGDADRSRFHARAFFEAGGSGNDKITTVPVGEDSTREAPPQRAGLGLHLGQLALDRPVLGQLLPDVGTGKDHLCRVWLAASSVP